MGHLSNLVLYNFNIKHIIPATPIKTAEECSQELPLEVFNYETYHSSNIRQICSRRETLVQRDEFTNGEKQTAIFFQQTFGVCMYTLFRVSTLNTC
jgi:hypothetical protein